MNTSRAASAPRLASLLAGATLILTSAHAGATRGGGPHGGRARPNVHKLDKPPSRSALSRLRPRVRRSEPQLQSFFEAFPKALERSLRSGRGAKELSRHELRLLRDLAAQWTALAPQRSYDHVGPALSRMLRALERTQKTVRPAQRSINIQRFALNDIIAATAAPLLRARGESVLGLERPLPGHAGPGKSGGRIPDAFGYPIGEPRARGYWEQALKQREFFEERLPDHARMPSLDARKGRAR